MTEKMTPPIPMPSAAARPSARDRAIAVRATRTKLGPGLMAPRVSAPSSAASETMGSTPGSVVERHELGTAARPLEHSQAPLEVCQIGGGGEVLLVAVERAPPAPQLLQHALGLRGIVHHLSLDRAGANRYR